MPLLEKIQTIGAKIEPTIGTAESLTATEGAFNAYDIDIQGDINVEEREGQGGFDRLQGIAGTRRGTMTFKTDIEWDGTTTMPAWASVFLPGCGFVESAQVYEPVSEAPGSNVKTLTLGCFKNGKFKSIAGAVGGFRIVLPSGKKCYIEWSFEGVWQPVTDAAIITPTYPTDTIIRFASATVQYDSVDLCVAEMSFDSGNVIVMRECPDTAAGFVSGIITDRYPMINADPEATLVATDDPYGDWLAGTQAACTVTLDGPSDSTIVITAPKAQLFNAQEGNRDKLTIDNLTWMANKNGANQDECMSITFNEATV